MKTSPIQSVALSLVLTGIVGLSVSPRVHAQASTGGIDVSQVPLFTQVAEAPLNMLVMGKDHKIYYEAYNDASDLNNDGALDIGYKPTVIDYYGNFNSFVCYVWSTDKFVPSSATANKKCSGKWSGDFLNYLTTSRMDALRGVLYGGWRQVDSTTETVLQGAYFPQDGHSWGKEYQSAARDGYIISEYSPLSAPLTGRYHLFAVTTLKGNTNTYPGYQAPVFRVLNNTDKRIWNWLSIEGPVAGTQCFTTTNTKVSCTNAAGTTPFPGHPTSQASFLGVETAYAIAPNLFGSGNLTTINCSSNSCNPFNAQQDNYLSIIQGVIRTNLSTYYQFRVDGDDSIDFALSVGGVPTASAGCYGGRGFGACGNLEKTAVVALTSNTDYSFKFRQEESTGGDGYRLEWRTCLTALETSCGTFAVVPGSATNGISATTISTYNLTPTTPAVTRDDYLVRVQVCPASDATLRRSTCKAYPNGQYKPTGILHDYGETSRMYFGLITGTQYNNLEGGVLRRNMGSFGDEINANTGQFNTNVNGIANTISKFRMIGGNYNSAANDGTGLDNTNADSNWNWANGTGSCTSQGGSALANGECRMWGNPLAEMLYESMRYYAGAAAPTPRFNQASSPGDGEETAMGLTKDTWKDPYASTASGGGGFPICARPFQTIISDINPSYDGDLPGSPFTGAVTTTGTTPASIAGFNAATEGAAIWSAEFGGGRNVFIGDVNNLTDGAPTAKTASSFGNIRGLSPEEPTKGGTYYTASVARFQRNNDVNAAPGPQKVATYAIALASPLPRIDFPVGNGKITLLPFGKTASGTFGGGTRKPTNTIVDFYVESIANLPGQPSNTTVNAGFPYAVFRINYEDVEQGNDHDMDAIVRYTIAANANGTVSVTLSSEYGAGSANQNMGYVLAGTTQDGVYLDVRDTDAPAFPYQNIAGANPTYIPSTAWRNGYRPYDLNTPPGLNPGDCAGVTSTECSFLPLGNTRIFQPTPLNGTRGATILNDPLWYAAKYGAPVPGNNDVNGDGVPDNYFLVTNPATLRTQLDKAFQDIIAQSLPSASIATSSPRYVQGSSLAYEVSYNATDWTGDLKAYQLSSDGTYANLSPIWSASTKMPAFGTRNIYTAQPLGTGLVGVPFTVAGMSTATQLAVQGALDPTVFQTPELIDFLRGDKSREVGQPTCTPTTCMYRKRSSNLGDVLNSTPAVIGVSSFGYSLLAPGFATQTAVDSYEAYVTSKKTIYGNSNNQPIIFVGSNDGMLHAFDGREGVGGGTELFAYVPRSILPKIHELARPNYTHKYFVDGTPSIGDAYLGGAWKTALVASVGAGGKGVYALDITAPRTFSATDLMWEFDSSVDPDMGQFVGRPAIGIAENTTASDRWITAFGNGYNSANQRAVLFIRNLATGASIAKLDTGVGCSLTQVGCTTGPNGLATATIVDNTGDGVGDTIYAGDYLGNVWRFEYTNNAWRIGNNNQPIFVARDGILTASKRQSITSGIYTVAHPLGGTMLVFGTGRYLNADDADDASIGVGTRPAVDTIYGIWDATRVYDPVAGTFTSTATTTAGATVDLNTLMSLAGDRAVLQPQQFTSYTQLTDTGTGGYRTATRNSVEFRTPDSPGSAASPRFMGWYIDMNFVSGSGAGSNLLAGERVTATPQGILNDVVINAFRPSGNSCSPGAQNATLVFDALTGAASFTPIRPPGGWPAGQQPPPGAIAGTDTGIVPPAGEPPIIVVRPPVPVVPCLPSDPNCTNPAVVNDIKSCSWRSPNAANRTPGKLIPCGRISWKQLR